MKTVDKDKFVTGFEQKIPASVSDKEEGGRALIRITSQYVRLKTRVVAGKGANGGANGGGSVIPIIMD